MPAENSVNDLFRFIQLRPKQPLQETPTIPMLEESPLAHNLMTAPSPQHRFSLANAALKNGSETVRSPDEVPRGPEILSTLNELKDAEDATTQDLLDKLPGLAAFLDNQQFVPGGSRLSDTLLASYFGTEGFPQNLSGLQALHRVYHLLRQMQQGTLGEPVSLMEFMSRPLLNRTPAQNAEVPSRGAGVPRLASPSPSTATTVMMIRQAVDELALLDRPEHLVQPDGLGLTGERGGTPFTLTEAARGKLTPATSGVLRELGVDTATTPIDTAIQLLLSHPLVKGGLLEWPKPVVTTQPGVTLPPPPGEALVRPAGVADLLVVKQQIKRYEAGEIAHVENILIGEKKSRAHRQLDRSEETVISESESTREKQTELETADRFELNKETSQTIQEDQQIGFGLSLSGKYGPTVEFSSNFNMNIDTSKEESSKSSSRYARDVVNRSLEKVTERVRQQRTVTTIHEVEETNLHELENKTASHIRGIYQFIDKVYEAQVFNYGVREMFDFMVPEPASFLWHVEQHPSLDLKLPPAPPDLNLIAPDATYVNEYNAPGLAAAYGATEIDPPPPLYVRLAVGFKHGNDDASEDDQPHSNEQKDLQIPAGYRPLRARVRGLAFTDENPVIGVVVGGQRVVWRPGAADRIGLSDGKQLAHQPELYLTLADEPYELTGEGKLGVSMVAWETNTFTLDITVVAVRTTEELTRWRFATYKKIRAAYDEKVQQYNQKVEELRAAAEAKAAQANQLPFGAPPAENKRTINTELKKHCLSIITQQRYDAFDATKDGTPPYFDFLEAAAEGAYIRFFEQAFEWDQMQYVFYPYFWSRKEVWISRFIKQEVDPEFLDFLKAGSARVVVPVRPGFEVAVTHYLETGKIWGGEEDPPQINTPLYVSIVDEIKERTGAPQGEIAVGDPWDVRVPTALVIVRDQNNLPAWERVAPDSWEWRPVEGS